MKHLEDKIILLGLIANTIPFKYENNELKADVLIYIEKSDLENEKKGLDMLLSNPLISEEEKQELNDEIYFINNVMENLGI